MKLFSKEERIQRIKDYWPYFVIGVLGILGAIGLNIYLIITDQYFHWTSTVLSLIPGIIFLFIWRFGKKLSPKKGTQIVNGSCTAGCLVFVLIAAYRICVPLLLNHIYTPYTYSMFYQKNYDGMKEKYSQYPEQIPNHIQDAIFSQHRWLGEGSLFLEYKTTNEEIQTLEDKHRSQAICIIEDVTNTDAQKETPDICSWDSYKSLWENKDYIDSLEVIVLNHYIEPSGNNEHCDTTGIAFDKTNSIVIYWTDAYWCRLGSEIYELYPDMHWGTP